MENICWGGIRPDSDEKESNQFFVELYYKGERLPIVEDNNGKLYYQFNFAIRERFRPLLMGMVTKTLKKYGEIFIDKEDLDSEAELKLYEKLTKYDETKGDSPLKFIESDLKHFHQLKSQTTESKEVLNIDCDEICRKEKEYTENLPCKYETSEGYCTDPIRKPKRKLKSAIDADKSLDELVYQEGDTTRIELIEDPDFDIETEILKKEIQSRLDKEERRLYQDYYVDEYTQEKMAEKHGVNQSTIHREIKDLEEKIRKIL